MFEHLGYFKEYWIGNKSLGTINSKKDREVVGYVGRKTEVVLNDLILSNGKKIKAGTEVVTFLYPICGKMIKENV